MAITRNALQRLVSIAIGPDNTVTHAFQTTTYQILENGVEIARHTSNQDNIEPAEIGAAVPQADLLKQLADQVKAADVFAASAKSAAEAGAKEIAGRDAIIASRDATIAERDVTIAAQAAQIEALTNAHQDMTARNAAAAAALTAAPSSS